MNVKLNKIKSVASAPPQAEPPLPKIKDIRIAIVSDAATERNGVGTFYVDLAEHLRKHGAQVTILNPRVENGKWKSGLVFPLPGDKTQKLCFPNPISLYRQLDDSQPDLVFIATPGVYGVVGCWLADRMGVPLIAGFHTSFEQLTELYWEKTWKGKFVHACFRMANLFIFGRCSTVLANSADMVEQARNAGADEPKLVTTPISPIFMSYPVKPFSGAVKRVLFAGRLAPEKNISSIAEAAARFPHIEFTLAGDGPLRDEVRIMERRLPNLTCLGWLNRESLRDQIDRHDALILPSHFESFGTIALEAMARRRLVVVSRGCGISAWPEYRDGLCIMDAKDLCGTLERLSGMTPNVLDALAESAWQTATRANRDALRQWLGLIVDLVRAGRLGR